MNKNDEIISKICNKERYEKILIDIAKENEKNNLTKMFNNISNNSKLEQNERNEIYHKVFIYINSINKSFEQKIASICEGVCIDTINEISKNNIK